MKAGECGAIEAILDAMKAHPNNADVCEQGCRALVNITVDGKQRQPQSKDNLEWNDFRTKQQQQLTTK